MSKFNKIRSEQRKRSTSTGTTPAVRIVPTRNVNKSQRGPNRSTPQQPVVSNG